MPVTERIVQQLRRQIEMGQFVQGDRLPSSRTLARQFNVSLNTVQAALGRLHAQGLITSQPRRRAVVGPQTAQARRSANRGGPIVLMGEPGSNYEHFQESWGSQVLFAAEHELAQRNLIHVRMYVPTVNYQIPADAMRKAQDVLMSASGVIWLASSGLSPMVLDAIERGLPVVTVNATPEIHAYNVVKADNVGGGRVVGRVFAELGLSRCLLLTRGIEGRRFSPELAQGFLDSFMKAGLPLQGLDYRDLKWDRLAEAEQLVDQYLRDNEPPQAIFAASDRLAIGALNACRSHGLRVPRDISIVSALGFERCRQTRPTLSAWQQPVVEVGKQAARMLLHLMKHPNDRLPPVVVPSSLVVRQSLPHKPALADIAGVVFDLS